MVSFYFKIKFKKRGKNLFYLLNFKKEIMTIEKTDHQIIVDANQQANTVIQNNIDLVNEKIQSNFKFSLN